jgi:hypothetical protein
LHLGGLPAIASVQFHSECVAQVDEGIVDKAADLDVASVMAMGFPPYRLVLVTLLALTSSPSQAKTFMSGLGGLLLPWHVLATTGFRTTIHVAR